MRRHAPGALFGLLLAAAACGKEPYSGPVTGKVLLRYRPPAGARYRYAFSQQSTIQQPGGPMASTGGQPVTLAMWLTQQVGQTVGNGRAVAVTAVIDSAHVTSPLVGNDVGRQLAGAKTSMVIDDHIRVVSADPASPLPQGASQVSGQLMAALRTMSFPFPDSAVGVGDSWTTQLQVPYTDFAGGQPVYAAMRLAVESLTVVRGDTVVNLGVEVQLPTKPIPVVLMGQRSAIALSGTITGAQRFSLTRGAVLATTYAGTIGVRMSGGTFGSSPGGMSLSVGQQASLQLLE